MEQDNKDVDDDDGPTKEQNLTILAYKECMRLFRITLKVFITIAIKIFMFPSTKTFIFISINIKMCCRDLKQTLETIQPCLSGPNSIYIVLIMGLLFQDSYLFSEVIRCVNPALKAPGILSKSNCLKLSSLKQNMSLA